MYVEVVVASIAGRDSKVHVFRLSDFERENGEPRGKNEIRDHRLEKTKGCHLYALSRPGGAHLRMVLLVLNLILPQLY